ncbi:MAG TPA: hypothetical protein VMB75_05950, partial [Rhodocyclaceae bacterium]|nr:hypothetical protein [Rhodocyclaceae bacterium]
MKVKLLVAALALIGAGAANAAINDGTVVGGSDLIFQAWDGTNSYVKDLGTGFNAFAYDSNVHATTHGADPGSAAFTVNLSGLNTSSLTWGIFAVKNVSDTTTKYGVLTTSDATGLGGTLNGATGSLITTLNSQIGNYTASTALNGATAGNIGSTNGAYPGLLGSDWAGGLVNGNG